MILLGVWGKSLYKDHFVLESRCTMAIGPIPKFVPLQGVCMSILGPLASSKDHQDRGSPWGSFIDLDWGQR